MNRIEGVVSPELMSRFPSGTEAQTFADWVANHVGLEQVLGLAGFLMPDFFEVGEYLFWDMHVAEKLNQLTSVWTPFGDDPSTVERYFNVINLGEFFLASADAAVYREDLLLAFGSVLQHYWGLALHIRFPESRFGFEIAHNLFDEEGVCFTFWQIRTQT